MEILGEFYPEGDNNVFLLHVCLIPVSLSYERKRQPGCGSWQPHTLTHENTQKHVCKEITYCVQTQTREQQHTVGEDKVYILVRDRMTFMLLLILESELTDQVCSQLTTIIDFRLAVIKTKSWM